MGRLSSSFPPEVRRRRPADWPAGDRAAWARAVALDAGPLDPPGPAAHLRPTTQAARAGAWGAYLSFLASTGLLEPGEPVADRLTPERLALWAAALRDRVRPNTVQRLLLDVSFAAAALAPERDWAWVRRHPARPRAAEVAAARKPGTVFDAPALTAAALDLCAAADAAPSRAAAQDHRDGLLLALAAYTGLRRANLAALRLGETLRAYEAGFRLVFAATAVKTHVTLDIPLPPRLVAPLRRHLERHRPLLLGEAPDHGFLWVGSRGQPLSYGMLYGIFRQRGLELIGQPIHPHAARHTIATGLLTADPRAVGLAGAALAHSGARSVTEVYDRSGRAGAEAAWRRLTRQAAREGR